MSALSRSDRAALRAALSVRHPWLQHAEWGPACVDAGECDRCGSEARLIATCGPVAWQYLGRACAAEVADDAWCDGHAEDAQRALAWLAALPVQADDAARLWWVSTGEVTLDPQLLERMRTRVLPAWQVPSAP